MNDRKYPSPEEIKEMQVEYYTKNESKNKQAKRYGMHPYRYRDLVEAVGYEAQKQKDYLVIKIERKRLAGALDILDRAGVKVIVPENFQLTEYVESKIND